MREKETGLVVSQECIGTDIYSLWIENDGRKAAATVDGKRVFETECGCRVVTDLEGNLLS